MNWLAETGWLRYGYFGVWYMYGYSRNQAGSRVYGMPPKLELTRTILKKKYMQERKGKKEESGGNDAVWGEDW